MHCSFTVALWRISQSRTATGQSGARGSHAIPCPGPPFRPPVAAPRSSRGECRARRRGVGVLGVERRFIDVFEERLCCYVIALSQQQGWQVVEARRGSEVLGTERLMPNRERFRKRPFNCA